MSNTGLRKKKKQKEKTNDEGSGVDGSKFTQVQCGKAMSLHLLVAQDVFEQKIYVALCF